MDIFLTYFLISFDRTAMEFLELKGSISSDPKEQYELMRRLWFNFYPRNKNTTMTSSGFEHVFLSEIKKKKIIGLHNWIYFAEAEMKGELNYKGWLKIIDLGEVRLILPSDELNQILYFRKQKLSKSS